MEETAAHHASPTAGVCNVTGAGTRGEKAPSCNALQGVRMSGSSRNAGAAPLCGIRGPRVFHRRGRRSPGAPGETVALQSSLDILLKHMGLSRRPALSLLPANPGHQKHQGAPSVPVRPSSGNSWESSGVR